MNTEQLLQYHGELCLKGRQIMAKKNHDYSGASGDTPFANFMLAEYLKITDAERGIILRITDKLARIITYLNAGELKVENESVEDAIVDNINYLVLLAGLIKQKSQQEKQPPQDVTIEMNPYTGKVIKYDNKTGNIVKS